MSNNQWKRLSLVLITGLASVASSAADLVIYSARNEQLIKPLFDAYQKKTGVEIQFITDKEGPLLARLQAEGANTPADVLLTVDAGNLWQAAQVGVLQPVQSETLSKNIPTHLRDPGNQWFGFSVRARAMFFNPDKIQASALSSYEQLADRSIAGKLCLRTSKKVYNQSLVAMMIAEHGEEKTEKVVKGWVSNLALPPFPDDTKLLEAIAEPRSPCAVGIANTYYFGRLMEKQPQLKLNLFWPNQASSGVHVNISGAGVTKHAKHRQAAIAFLEWLSSEQAQNLFADANMEYPVNPNVKAAEFVTAWGPYKANLINVAKAGELQVQATMLMDRAGYK
ncbi:extracellular solute-binding protein [Permianibacter aggregans]|uniref:Iron(III) transport system substrate-binding protein n=1 Tax=Permianibacter aggregans TaxID=1510150 RepID=A0A4R6UMX4_9GAMM|nr:extracellular solute-binding protein [Permianibacter aggregans]QGX41057.1 extracellular solute-binding protein [Permianibacter aggregans]TDQ48122.1 iron(III) transport system substrate-binding protein [Permianibacter aggregans]